MLSKLEGYKTYIVAVLIGVAAAAQALGYTVPEWIYAVLGALGLGAVRAGAKR